MTTLFTSLSTHLSPFYNPRKNSLPSNPEADGISSPTKARLLRSALALAPWLDAASANAPQLDDHSAAVLVGSRTGELRSVQIFNSLHEAQAAISNTPNPQGFLQIPIPNWKRLRKTHLKRGGTI